MEVSNFLDRRFPFVLLASVCARKLEVAPFV